LRGAKRGNGSSNTASLTLPHHEKWAKGVEEALLDKNEIDLGGDLLVRQLFAALNDKGKRN
jgi:hypothetical protein